MCIKCCSPPLTSQSSYQTLVGIIGTWIKMDSLILSGFPRIIRLGLLHLSFKSLASAWAEHPGCWKQRDKQRASQQKTVGDWTISQMRCTFGKRISFASVIWVSSKNWGLVAGSPLGGSCSRKRATTWVNWATISLAIFVFVLVPVCVDCVATLPIASTPPVHTIGNRNPWMISNT